MIVGCLDHEVNGDIVARGYDGLIVGRYDKANDGWQNYLARQYGSGSSRCARKLVIL